ncbi:hypothetical protein LINPERHAP2_LOCUS41208, partial [Linum perenne]
PQLSNLALLGVWCVFNFLRVCISVPAKKPKKPQKIIVQIQSESLWLSTWELPVHPKHKFFLWRMLHRIIPTKDCLIDRNMEVHPSCAVCHLADESLEHLLFECPISMAFYRMAWLTPDDTRFDVIISLI